MCKELFILRHTSQIKPLRGKYMSPKEAATANKKFVATNVENFMWWVAPSPFNVPQYLATLIIEGSEEEEN